MPDDVMRVIADDWGSELSGYPSWALKKAFAWWIGRDNPKRRQKPLPGDISDRAHVEMSIVRAAKIRSNLKTPPAGVDPDDRPVSPETAALILREAGFTPKRMDGAA